MKPSVIRSPVTDNPCGVLARGWQLRPSGLPEQRHDLWRGGNVRVRLPRWSAAPKLKMGGEAVAESVADWTRLLREGTALTLPARHQVTVLIDTDDYLCGFPLFEFSGGAGTLVRCEWAESLFEKEEPKPKFDNTPGYKGDRSAVAGKLFFGFGDTWKLGGAGRRWASTPWWRSGRYLLVSVKVGAKPVTLHTLAVARTGFPLVPGAKLETSRTRMR